MCERETERQTPRQNYRKNIKNKTLMHLGFMAERHFPQFLHQGSLISNLNFSGLFITGSYEI